MQLQASALWWKRESYSTPIVHQSQRAILARVSHRGGFFLKQQNTSSTQWGTNIQWGYPSNIDLLPIRARGYFLTVGLIGYPSFGNLLLSYTGSATIGSFVYDPKTIMPLKTWKRKHERLTSSLHNFRFSGAKNGNLRFPQNRTRMEVVERIFLRLHKLTVNENNIVYECMFFFCVSFLLLWWARNFSKWHRNAHKSKFCVLCFWVGRVVCYCSTRDDLFIVNGVLPFLSTEGKFQPRIGKRIF